MLYRSKTYMIQVYINHTIKLVVQKIKVCNVLFALIYNYLKTG